MPEYREVAKTVLDGVSRAFGEKPLWPTTDVSSARPEIQIATDATMTAKLQLKWGDHTETYDLTAAEALDMHDRITAVLRQAYERQTTPAA